MDERKKEERRRFVRKIAAVSLGSGILAHWIKPICNSVILPSHALTSMPLLTPEDPQITRLAVNAPPQGENVVIDAQYALPVSYSMLPHISDPESLATELTLAIDSLPENGVIELLDEAVIVYQLQAEYVNAHGGSDHFNYHVIDPQGARSPTYRVDVINLPYVER